MCVWLDVTFVHRHAIAPGISSVQGSYTFCTHSTHDTTDVLLIGLHRIGVTICAMHLHPHVVFASSWDAHCGLNTVLVTFHSDNVSCFAL